MPNPSNSDLVGEAPISPDELAAMRTNVGQARLEHLRMSAVASALFKQVDWLAQQLEQAEQLATENGRLAQTHWDRAERYREALARARQDITELHSAGFDSARREVANQACARIDAALTPDEGADPGGR